MTAYQVRQSPTSRLRSSKHQFSWASSCSRASRTMLRRALQSTSTNTPFLQALSRQIVLAAEPMQRTHPTASFASAAEPKDGDAKVDTTSEAKPDAHGDQSDGMAQDLSVAELQVISQSLLEYREATFAIQCLNLQHYSCRSMRFHIIKSFATCALWTRRRARKFACSSVLAACGSNGQGRCVVRAHATAAKV